MEKPLPMTSMSSLLDPKAVAVVGASQRRSRGTSVLMNLIEAGFKGEVFAVNPRYQDIHGRRCFPSVTVLPASVDCLAVAVAADAACEVLEEAFAHGIRAAVVMAAGFGEGGHGEARAMRLRSLADKGMRICGPNCFGFINRRDRMPRSTAGRSQNTCDRARSRWSRRAEGSGRRCSVR